MDSPLGLDGLGKAFWPIADDIHVFSFGVTQARPNHITEAFLILAVVIINTTGEHLPYGTPHARPAAPSRIQARYA